MPYSGMIIKRFYLFTTSFSNVKELTKLSKYYGVEEKKMLYKVSLTIERKLETNMCSIIPFFNYVY